MAAAGRRDSALVGLAILAAGRAHGPRVNREAMVRQREQLNTGWMCLGEWFSTHPPLARRMASLDPALDALTASSVAGTIRALGIIGAAVAVPIVGTVIAVTMLMGAVSTLAARTPARSDSAAFEKLLMDSPPTGATAAAQTPAVAQPASTEPLSPVANVGEELAKIQVSIDLTALAGVVEMERARGSVPTDVTALYAKVAERHPDEAERRDAFGGQRYKYEPRDGYYLLRSVGPDGQPGTADDIVHDSRRQ
jgi:hypothetical protein